MGKKKGKGKQGEAAGGKEEAATSKQPQQPQTSQEGGQQRQQQPKPQQDRQRQQQGPQPTQPPQRGPQQGPPPAAWGKTTSAPQPTQPSQQGPPPAAWGKTTSAPQQAPQPPQPSQQGPPPAAWGKTTSAPQQAPQQTPPTWGQKQQADAPQQPGPMHTTGQPGKGRGRGRKGDNQTPPGDVPRQPAWGQQQQAPQQQIPQQQAPQQQMPQQQAPQQQMPQQQAPQQRPPQQRPPQQQAPQQRQPQQRPPQQQAPQFSGPPSQTAPPGYASSGAQPPKGGGGGGDVPKQAGRGTGPKQQQHKPGMSGDHATPKKTAPPTSQMSSLALEPLTYKKAVPGTKGRRIPVETNHLALNLGKLDFAYHYDVALEPDTPKKFLRKVMDLFQKQHYPKINAAFDGRKNLYSTTKLCPGDFVSGEIVIQDTEGREKIYQVEVKLANQVDLRPLRNHNMSQATPREALQVVDIVLRCAPALSLISVGRSFFQKPQGEILDLGEGMEMYYGFYQSAIRGWKPFLNVDVAHKAFPKNMSVIDALMEVLSGGYNRFERDDLKRPLNASNKEVFGKFIKTLRVVYQIPGQSSTKRVFRVNGLEDCASRKTFDMDDNGRVRNITIKEYFERYKRCPLKYPELPTLWVGSQARKTNPILVPLELCCLEEGQVLNRKMTENQTAKMIRYSATNTETRKKKIVDGIRRANHNAHPVVREFGFSLSDKFEQLDARVLDPPQLGYVDALKPRLVNPFKGVWKNERFVTTAQIKNWTIVCADRRDPRPNELNYLEKGLMDAARGTGIQFPPAEKPFQTIGNIPRDIQKYFGSVKGKYDVIFVVVPNSGPQYSYVKTAAEINVGCLTQCIKLRTLGKANLQTCINILLKVNAKLNGTNHFLATRPPMLSRPCMIMGADVTHPSPDSQHIPSVAAVTASFDPKAFRYNICWRLQPPRVEIIEDLQNIVVEQLKYFHTVNKGMKPERIIFFRDGVSEGQFEQVKHAEVRAIKAACKKLQPDGYEPAITFLVVQKRHHTRLFPLNPRDSDDRNCNVPAGTCVDQLITHPFLQDFYLVSHASIQGVAKPTKYCTIVDENELSNDAIEELTYFLCHMFARCNRSVSYPAPTYYAHLAAARAKVYIENDQLDLNNLQREYNKFIIQDSIRKDRPMFFV